MKCEVFALAASGVTVASFWQDSRILAKLVSILVSAGALSSSTHCVSTHWKWSQLSDSNRRPMVYKTIALPLS